MLKKLMNYIHTCGYTCEEHCNERVSEAFKTACKCGTSKKSIRDVYSFKKKIASGAFGKVRKIERKRDGKLFACKEIRKNKLSAFDLKTVKDEVKILSKVKHENCVRMHDHYETKDVIYLVLDLLEGGELFDRIVQKQSFSEKEAATVIYTVAQGLDYLHGIGVVHRDLKPENLLYENEKEDSRLVIIDFGLAAIQDNAMKQNLNTACGTPGYVAPEILKSEQYGKEVDLWSLGVILYVLLCGTPPFFAQRTIDLYEQIKKAEYSFKYDGWEKISKEAKDVVRGLLELDTKKRTTTEQLLKHTPWVTGAASAQKFSEDYVKNLRLTNGRRKFRALVRSIIAVNRIVRALARKANDNA